MTKKFQYSDFELNAMPLSELVAELTMILAQDKTAVVSIRQCNGADFPPFMAVESKEEYERVNAEGEFVIC